jgi:hypothetical protein
MLIQAGMCGRRNSFQCLPTNKVVMWSLVSKAVTESIAISDELKGIPHDL